MVQEMVQAGIHNFGILIEPKEFTKVSIVEDKIVKSKYQVHGRKIPLKYIREKMFRKHQSLVIMKNKTSCDRKIMVWTDHADILGKVNFSNEIQFVFLFL